MLVKEVVEREIHEARSVFVVRVRVRCRAVPELLGPARSYSFELLQKSAPCAESGEIVARADTL